jgi:hypothetical protein
MIELKLIDEIKSDSEYKKILKANEIIDIESVIEILKQFENENTKLQECMSLFDDIEEEEEIEETYYSIEELERLYSLPYDELELTATYVDSNTHNYLFEISFSTYSDYVTYTVDKIYENIINTEIKTNKALEDLNKAMSSLEEMCDTLIKEKAKNSD